MLNTPSEKARTGLLYQQYSMAVFDSILWVQCIPCCVDVFTWRSARKFNVSQLDSAIREHEKVWHTEQVR